MIGKSTLEKYSFRYEQLLLNGEKDKKKTISFFRPNAVKTNISKYLNYLPIYSISTTFKNTFVIHSLTNLSVNSVTNTISLVVKYLFCFVIVVLHFNIQFLYLLINH